jgi:hypothetical protein
VHYHRWVSPFGDRRITGCLPPTRRLSQATTSFFGFCRQGIHHMLLRLLISRCWPVVSIQPERIGQFPLAILIDRLPMNSFDWFCRNRPIHFSTSASRLLQINLRPCVRDGDWSKDTRWKRCRIKQKTAGQRHIVTRADV